MFCVFSDMYYTYGRNFMDCPRSSVGCGLNKSSIFFLAISSRLPNVLIFICNSQKLEANPTSTNGQMDQQLMVYLHNGIPAVYETEWTTDTQHGWFYRSLYWVKGERSVEKEFILHYFTY